MAGRGGQDGWWTKEEEKKLRKLADAGYDRYEAAAAFGCNVDRISVKAKKLGIRLRPKSYWKSSEIAKLKRMAANDKTVEEIARALHRSAGAVYGYARKYGVVIKTVSELGRPPENFGQHWSVSDETELKNLVNEQMPVDKIANKIDRTPSAVRARMSRLGLRYRT